MTALPTADAAPHSMPIKSHRMPYWARPALQNIALDYGAVAMEGLLGGEEGDHETSIPEARRGLAIHGMAALGAAKGSRDRALG